jgi:hypothetical protein
MDSDLIKIIKEAAGNDRIYEYIADDGVHYFSFDKSTQTISKPKRLVLQSRVGKHVINFLNDLRKGPKETEEK